MRKPPLQDVIVKNRNTNAIRRRKKIQKDKHPRDRVAVAGDDVEHFESKRNFSRDTTNRHAGTGFGDFDRDVSDGSNKKWVYFALGIGGVVILTSVILSFLFAGATVTAYPKQDTVIVNAAFTAGSNVEDGDLPINTIVLEKTEKQEVVALGEEEVEERASGKITIYNDFSETPQRLIKNTRFKSSKKLIYRIRESVEVPGRKTDGTPGQVEVTVFAEEPGEKYNTGPDTFSIPGFVGLPQEGKVYAKSTSDITGGYVGIRRTVNEKERMSALEKLESKLRDELLAEAFDDPDNPDGYHLFKEAVFFEFNTLPDEVVGKDKVTLSLTGKLHGILFPEDMLSRRIAEITLSSYDGAPLKIENINDLSVSVSPIKNGDDDVTKYPWKATSFNVVAQGKAHFIWDFDEKKMVEYFVGKDKDILETMPADEMMKRFPGIDRISVNVRPFWKSKFPDTADKIDVNIKLDG
jgi:hypothetical protein